MIVKILAGSLLALSAANAVAGNMYIYKDKEGRALLTSVNPSSNLDKFSKKVKVTDYRDLDKKTINPLPQKNLESEKDKRSKDTYIQVVHPQVAQPIHSELKFEVPDGYRLPTKADVIGDWKRFDAPNHLKADFNGDGIEDEAYILPKKGLNAGYGVFVSINKSKTALQRGHKFQMFKLTSDDMSPQSFAIELAEPSHEIWQSACGKGYWKCATGEPSAFKINHPSIMFCYIESACTIYMWDTNKLTFKEIRFSD